MLTQADAEPLLVPRWWLPVGQLLFLAAVVVAVVLVSVFGKWGG